MCGALGGERGAFSSCVRRSIPRNQEYTGAARRKCMRSPCPRKLERSRSLILAAERRALKTPAWEAQIFAPIAGSRKRYYVGMASSKGLNHSARRTGPLFSQTKADGFATGFHAGRASKKHRGAARDDGEDCEASAASLTLWYYQPAGFYMPGSASFEKGSFAMEGTSKHGKGHAYRGQCWRVATRERQQTSSCRPASESRTPRKLLLPFPRIHSSADLG